MSNPTPSATHGWNSTVIYDHNVGSSAGMPFFRKKFPKTLLRTTTVAQIQVLIRRRAASVAIGRASVARADRHRRRFGRFGVGNELSSLAPQGHVLARLLGEAAAFIAIENGLAHDAPDHPRAEKVFAVES